MTDLPVHRFQGRDGVDLAYREMGDGRPLVLLHGFVSTATVNWIRFGHAEVLAARGHRVVMPDLRGHGDSAAPHDPSFYPPDVLADDGLALIEHLALTGYDLGGYSLGARTVIRMLVRGATPGRAIVAGMGLEAVLRVETGAGFYRRVLGNPGTFERGTSEWMTDAFVRQVGGDPVALLHVLEANVDTPREALDHITTPTLVAAGADDGARRSAEELAAALPHGHFIEFPGNHMGAVTKPELALAIADFLDER